MERSDDSVASTRKSLLIEFLRTGDSPCPTCGYNLRGLTHNVCTECGTQFELRIGEVQRHFAYVLWLLVPGVMTCGYSILLIVACLMSEPPPSRYWGVYLAIAVGLISGGAVPFVYSKRALLVRTSQGFRLMSVLIVWLTYVALAVFWIIQLLY